MTSGLAPTFCLQKEGASPGRASRGLVVRLCAYGKGCGIRGMRRGMWWAFAVLRLHIVARTPVKRVAVCPRQTLV